MRSKKEIINSVFYVINTKSIDSLDGVDIFIQRAFENLYAKKSTLVDKHIAFNQLVTKFEAYLKKLYYLINGKELSARNEGDTPSWKDALYAHKCLWNLRWSTDEAKQQLYKWLLLVKGWRNERVSYFSNSFRAGGRYRTQHNPYHVFLRNGFVNNLP